MSTQTLQDKLVFATETGESLLPPECALLILTSTLATPGTFIVHHFLQELLKTPKKEGEAGIVFLSFLNGFEQLAPSVKKLVLSYSG